MRTPPPESGRAVPRNRYSGARLHGAAVRPGRLSARSPEVPRLNFELPDKMSVQSRLRQDAQGRIGLHPRYRVLLMEAADTVPMVELPPPAERVLDEVARLIDSVRNLQLTVLRHPQFGPVLYRLADRLIGLARRAPHGAIAAVMLGPRDPYTACHAVYCALLGARLALRLRLDPEETLRLVCAALTMNLSFWLQQERLAQQADILTSRQRQEVELHPLLSSALLHEAGIDYPLLHELVLCQHESASGRGYPFRFRSQPLPALLPVLQLLDRFVAKLMPRSYRKKVETRTAMATLYTRLKDSADQDLAAMLIKEVGLYPPGSVVELESGVKALVVEATDNAGCPRVVLPASHTPVPTEEAGRRVVRAVPVTVDHRQQALFLPFWSLAQS